MLKYVNIGSMIEVELDGVYKGYSVMAMYLPFSMTGEKDEMSVEHEEEYRVDLWLRDNTIYDALPIDMQKMDCQFITASKRTIKKRLTRLISNLCENGEFDYYVDRYIYYCDCFDYGNNYYETNNNYNWIDEMSMSISDQIINIEDGTGIDDWE